jgi:hypothetical protein
VLIAILALDNFTSKYGVFSCILIVIVPLPDGDVEHGRVFYEFLPTGGASFYEPFRMGGHNLSRRISVVGLGVEATAWTRLAFG